MTYYSEVPLAHLCREGELSKSDDQVNQIWFCESCGEFSKRISQLEAENARLRLALSAYADEGNWEQGGSDGGNLWTGELVEGNKGIWGADIAQKALAESASDPQVKTAGTETR